MTSPVPPQLSFSVISVFPEMVEQMCSYGVVGQAIKKGLIKLYPIQLRDFVYDVHRTVDDRPFGGGDGMVMLAEPLRLAIEAAQSERKSRVIYLSPQGKTLDHATAKRLSEESDLILICGRYGGIDQRVINQYVDEEISIGDYVLSGGEMAAGVLIDVVSRHLPGVLGHAESAESDSFAQGLLEAPAYTRPRVCLDQEAPQVLLSGNHQKVHEWQRSVAMLVTLLKRRDLLKSHNVDYKKLHHFWQSLSEAEREVLGLGALNERDFE